MGLAVDFIIPGEPRAWKRAASNGAQRFTPASQKRSQTDIGWIARQAGVRATSGPVSVTIVSVFKPAQRLGVVLGAALHGRPVTTVPDADNCAKMILDALNGIAYLDDAQVASLSVRKVYGPVAQTNVSVSGLPDGSAARLVEGVTR